MVGAVRVVPGVWYSLGATTGAKAERIYGYVYAFVAAARKHPDFTPVEVRSKEISKENSKVP
jgi:hypothetical protein